jgi:ABC-type multidrug transport system ATPase subunit
VSHPAIAVDNITKRFGNHTAVEGVSFTVKAGLIYGILGPNGAGKSTTLRMINDIIRPDAGAIAILAGPRREQTHRLFARRTRLVPQDESRADDPVYG